jgi:membrane-bound serine protease (ClpP class)
MKYMIKKDLRKSTARLFLFILIVAFTFPTVILFAQNDEQTVYIIPIDGEITPAMASFLEKQLDEANSKMADGVIIDIKTLGGRVDSAIKMRDAIIDSTTPVVVYIGNRAISAGALISIASETIIMAPGSHIGSAEPVPNEPKALAYVSGEFKTTAERTGRDPEIALAMVDSSIEIEGLVGAGEILDLTASEAFDVGYADHIARGRSEVLEIMGWENAKTIETTPDFRFRIAQFLTSYEVASILLTIGMIGIIAEFFTQGFGAAGIIGLSCVGLYFASGFIAGNTELWSVLVFVAGVVLIILEISAPGFGVFGLSGIIAILVSVVFSAPTVGLGFRTLLISVTVSLAAIPIFFKLFGRSKFMKRIVLATAETPDQGYTHADRKDSLLGKTGVAQTVLRPSGSVYIDNIKVDAIADGEFIPKGVDVTVIRVEGVKVFVAPIKK